MIYIDYKNPVFHFYPRQYHYKYDITLIDMLSREDIIRLYDVEVFEYSRGVVGLGLDIELKPNKRYYLKVYHTDTKELMFNGVTTTDGYDQGYDKYNNDSDIDENKNDNFIKL